MKKLLVFSLAFVIIISALLLLAGCKKECDHSYEKTATPPTCTEAGEEKFSCTKCDYCYTTKIEATGHTGGTPVEKNRTDATCTVDGKYDTIVYCTVCEAELSRDTTILKSGHTGGTPVEENRTEATCTVDGKYDSVVYCTVCDAEVSRETVTVTEKIHDVQDGICTVCGGKESTAGLKYIQNDDGTYTVAGVGTCAETDIVIGIYNNRDVTSIGKQAFKGCDQLTSMLISDSVTRIGSAAFWGCVSMKSVVIPGGVTTIGEYALYGCLSLTIYCEVTSRPDGWSSYWNDSGIRVVWGCGVDDDLVYKITDAGVSVVGYIGRDNDVAIPSVIEGKPVTSIGEMAFCECGTLTSVEIPDGVTAIGNSAFSCCTSLTSIELPDGITAIGNDAFSCCTSLTSIELPDGITAIGNGAFWGCASLTSIAIPDGITVIGDYTFYYCTSLTGIEIPDGVTAIGVDAFYFCTSLTSIEIPGGITSIGERAFYECTLLTIYCEATSKPEGWSSDWNFDRRPVVWGCRVSDDGFVYKATEAGASIAGYIGTDKDLVIPAVIEGIPVIAIGEYAFYECDSLKSIVVPEGVAVIRYHAFEGCISLTRIELPDSLTTIGIFAFYYCASLTSIELPDSLTTIGDYAFYECTSLTIYCEVAERPSGWSDSWNPSNRPVVWGYKGE